jgi:hypothetical protein
MLIINKKDEFDNGELEDGQEQYFVKIQEKWKDELFSILCKKQSFFLNSRDELRYQIFKANF